MSNILSLRASRLLASAVALLVSAPASAVAQQVAGPRLNFNMSIPELLREFTKQEREPSSGRWAMLLVTGFLWQHQEPIPAPRLDSLIAGLEQLALTGETLHLRVRATGALGWAGDTLARNPRKGMVTKLSSIYKANDDSRVRMAVLNARPKQAEREAAAAFLGEVLQKPPDRLAFSTEARDAIGPLLQLNDAGREVLRRIHRAGTVKDPEARRVLDELAKQGFGLKPPR